jgi:hypothetical protein
MVRVPTLVGDRFHFSQTSNETPRLPISTGSVTLALTHLVGRPCCLPLMVLFDGWPILAGTF